MSMDARGVYVLAKTGLTELGGKELDEKVGEMVLNQFQRAMGQPLSLGARTLLELRRVSEEIKIELCNPGKSRLRRMVMLGGHAVEVEIAKKDFEASIKEYLDRAEAEIMVCVREAGLRFDDIGSCLLVGGSSLVPAVETARALFGRPGQQVCITTE
jgi:molecular chaperone DnaK (HSP70)